VAVSGQKGRKIGGPPGEKQGQGEREPREGFRGFPLKFVLLLFLKTGLKLF
jgi:hypothetical protein